MISKWGQKWLENENFIMLGDGKVGLKDLMVRIVVRWSFPVSMSVLKGKRLNLASNDRPATNQQLLHRNHREEGPQDQNHDSSGLMIVQVETTKLNNN